MFSIPKTPINSPSQNNSNLEKTMSVSVILKELNMQEYGPIFAKEEVSFIFPKFFYHEVSKYFIFLD
jgi:hypothetical protein